MKEHPERFTRGEDGSYWFVNEKRPPRMNFDSLPKELMWACAEYPERATMEQIYRLLCTSTVGGAGQIERRKMLRELSRRSELFGRVGRAKYVCLKGNGGEEVEGDVENEPEQVGWSMIHGDEEFDACASFDGGFELPVEEL